MNVVEAIKIIEDGPETSIAYGESLLLINDGMCYSIVDLAEWNQAKIVLCNGEYENVMEAYTAMCSNTTALLCSLYSGNKLENVSGREAEVEELCGENWRERFITITENVQE